jgi:hypothetical protein
LVTFENSTEAQGEAMRWRIGVSAVVAGSALLSARAALTQTQPQSPLTDPSLGITVTATRLDEARSSIQPSLGATTYGFTPRTIGNVPLGENAPLNQVLLRAPGVVQDSFGQIHVRGDMGNVQYRLDGVQLPEGLSLFNNILMTRYARQLSLLTGALPAQYGLQTAGIVDIAVALHLRSGADIPRDARLPQPAFSYGGRTGKIDYFLAGFLKNALHRNRRRRSRPPRRADQRYGLAKITGIIDDQTRVSFISGSASSRFQIPTFLWPANFTVFSNTERRYPTSVVQTYRNRLVTEERPLDFQLSGFARYSNVQLDAIAICCTTASHPDHKTFAAGVHGDGSWRVARTTVRRLPRARAATSHQHHAGCRRSRDLTSDRPPDQPIGHQWPDLIGCTSSTRRMAVVPRDREFRPASTPSTALHRRTSEPAHQRRVAQLDGAYRLFALLRRCHLSAGGDPIDRARLYGSLPRR